MSLSQKITTAGSMSCPMPDMWIVFLFLLQNRKIGEKGIVNKVKLFALLRIKSSAITPAAWGGEPWVLYANSLKYFPPQSLHFVGQEEASKQFLQAVSPLPNSFLLIPAERLERDFKRVSYLIFYTLKAM